MKKAEFIKFAALILGLFSASLSLFAQDARTSQIKSHEVSELDGVPVLIKHLPDWQNARNGATLTDNIGDLRTALGERPVFDLVDFSAGTEAVTAPYSQGKLLIVEYASPQISVEADAQFIKRLAEIRPDPPIFYRRIGNYCAFVFDAADEASANSLLDQIKYEKVVQWLGEDPTLLQRAERAFVITTSDIFLSTVIVIVLGIAVSIFTGFISGIVFFYVREHKRAGLEAFSDAGGMIRLNLDDLTPDISADRLLK